MTQKLVTVPLCQLQRSRTNVRKTNPKANIEELAASIAVHGLLQNLTVRPCASKTNDSQPMYEVVAGGRRLAALKLLAKRKRIAKDAPVLCLVLDEDDAVEVSLAENAVRTPLHPADQFEAFSKLQTVGHSIEDIAARFGISESMVRQRLKLAAVSPKLMDVYRHGDMGLDQLVAFTITDDHEAQERAWFDTPAYQRQPQSIRHALTQSLVHANDRRARFVGIAAYEAAGGTVIRDLFDPEDGGYFADSVVLDRLVAEKLAAEAEKLGQEGWTWVETAVETNYEALTRFRRVPPDLGGLTEEEDARLEELSEQHDALIAELDGEAPAEIAAKLDRIEAEINALSERQQQWSDDAKACAGVFISLDYQGLVSVTRGLIKPNDRGDPDAASDQPKAKGMKDANGVSQPTLSEALREDLSAHRTAALREALAERSDVALTALLFALVRSVFYGEVRDGCVCIRPVSSDLRLSAEGIGESKAAQALAKRRQRLQEKLPDLEELWTWLAAQRDVTRAKLLAFCVAVTLDVVHRRHAVITPERQTESELIAEAIGLDMAKWWEPTRESYFSRVPKTLILAAVSEAVTPQAAENIERLKKDAMALRAEELLADKRWLPEPLRQTTRVANAAE